MELNDNAKRAVRELGDAINSAIEKSGRVAEAIQALRGLGFEPNLALKLEIGLQEAATDPEEKQAEAGDVELELTEEDLRTLRSMKIRLE